MQMHHQPRIVTGVEERIGTARRDQRQDKVLTLELENCERVFLLYGLRDIPRSIDAILHNVPPGKIVSPWTRDRVRTTVISIRDQLDKGALVLLVIRPLDRAVIQYAIEANQYFAFMADDDPRLTVAQVRAANALRCKVSKLFGQPIKRVWLGVGRDRLAVPV